MQSNSSCIVPELFYELVRLSINDRKRTDSEISSFDFCNLPTVPSKSDWYSLFNLAKKQALVGVCFEGIQTLYQSFPDVITSFPTALRLQWIGLSASITGRNELLNHRCLELQEKLNKAGFKCCILKGQGNLQYYPEELRKLRQSGDIDVWLWCDGNLRQRRKKIIEYARAITPGAPAFFHHVDCDITDDVPVELHYLPSWFNNPFINKKFVKWCEKNGTKETSKGSERILTPSISFNLVYQLIHIYQHLFMEGIGLRQLMDYYMLLESVDWIDKEMLNDVRATLESFKLRRFTSAVMWVLFKVFGLKQEKMVFEPDEKEGKFLLREIEQAGNFGHYDRRLKRKGKSLIWLFIIHFKRNLHFLTHYPGETLWSPLFKLWHWCWRNVCLR